MMEPVWVAKQDSAVVVTKNYYGKGDTLEEALKQCERTAGALSKAMVKEYGYIAYVFESPVGIKVNGIDGSVSWTLPEGSDEVEYETINKIKEGKGGVR